jgi:non-specific serine/threonine protein kinase
LLSLIGIGGVGKTRLAKEAIAGLRRSFRDGVCFVDLTALQDEALLEQVVRDSVPGASGATSLVSQLADLNLLLVLDNCEHVCDALGSEVHRGHHPVDLRGIDGGSWICRRFTRELPT